MGSIWISLNLSKKSASKVQIFFEYMRKNGYFLEVLKLDVII